MNEQNATDKAVAFLIQVDQEVVSVKPEASAHEVIGVAYQILSKTIETLKNEQLQKSSPSEGSAGTPGEPGQVQGTGEARGIEEGSQGVRSEQERPKTGDRKKRRGSKKA